MTDHPNRSAESCDLKPCPFCGSEIKHIESWAKSFDPPRLYHEWHHVEQDIDCPVWRQGRIVASATEDQEMREIAVRRWNRRIPTDAQPMRKPAYADEAFEYDAQTGSYHRIPASQPSPAATVEPVLSGLQEDLILMSFHNEPAATVEAVGMTYNTIKAAFDEYRKTLTVMDTRPSFDSFSQGYVAGWNAKEAQPHNGSSAGSAKAKKLAEKYDRILDRAKTMRRTSMEMRVFEDDMETIIAALRVLNEPQQVEVWQPVETAPHETRVILGWWSALGDKWECETGYASHGWQRNGISTMSRHGQATHWQPLPSPLSRPTLGRDEEAGK